MLEKLDRNDPAIFVGFMALSFLIYWPVLAFPYLLADETWLLRGEDAYASKWYISVVQGRPALLVMSHASAWLFQTFGELGVQLMRGAAIATVGASSALLYVFSKNFSLTQPFRILAAALWITLPAAQVIIANGTWLSVGIAASIGAMIILDRRPTALSIVSAVFLLWVAATTYQSCFFIAPALFAITFYKRPLREAIVVGVVIAGSFLVYFLSWRLLYAVFLSHSGESRYNPGALSALSDLPRHIYQHGVFRFHLITNGWDVETGFPRIRSYVNAFVVVATTASGVLYLMNSSRRVVFGIVVPIFAFAAALFIADFPVIASKAVIQSYTTYIGITIVLSIAVAFVFSNLLGRHRLASMFCIAVLAFGSVIASVSVTRHFAIPTWLTSAIVRPYITERVAAQPEGLLSLCYIGTRHQHAADTPDPAYGQAEFTWTNFSHELFAYWSSRSLMMLDGIDRPLVSVLIRDPVGSDADGIYPPGSKPNCGAGDFLDLSTITKHDLFRRGVVEPIRIR